MQLTNRPWSRAWSTGIATSARRILPRPSLSIRARQSAPWGTASWARPAPDRRQIGLTHQQQLHVGRRRARHPADGVSGDPGQLLQMGIYQLLMERPIPHLVLHVDPHRFLPFAQLQRVRPMFRPQGDGHKAVENVPRLLPGLCRGQWPTQYQQQRQQEDHWTPVSTRSRSTISTRS